MLLENIKCPDDLKGLTNEQLNTLSSEIRDFLVSEVSKTGGHLASNLGIVELTLAIHKCFNLPTDKIVWDVGHQAYVHKMLTGRMPLFSTLRQFGGMSGFPKTSESEYDCFNTGHSSTSISAALGLARGRDLAGDDYNVLAVFGDGALTGGMMYEALNDTGHSKTKFIAILNDNAMSISANVGAISGYLKRLRSKPGYFKSKQRVERFLNHVPLIGKPLIKLIRKIKWGIKQLVLPSTIFDDLGFEYLGPVDGHDIKALTAVLERAKRFDKPVFVHVHTQKGKGYQFAEENPTGFHGVSKFDAEVGLSESSENKVDYSAIFGNKLISIAKENEKVVAITPAMPAGSGLSDFAKEIPDRFFDVGIAEQHALTFAAGMAASGFVPVVPVYSSFLQRAYDQVLHDICLQNLHVVIPVDRAGIVGADGETHQGVYDIAYLSHMPNMTILSPSSFSELEKMLDYAINTHTGPIAIRYPRGNTQAENTDTDFVFGRANVLSEGSDVSIVATGRMLTTAENVCLTLKEKGISAELISVGTIKPLDEKTILESAKKTGVLVTIEDGTLIGGMGSMISASLTENNVNVRFHSFGFSDKPITHGSIKELDKLFGLDSITIADKTLELVKRNGDISNG